MHGLHREQITRTKTIPFTIGVSCQVKNNEKSIATRVNHKRTLSHASRRVDIHGGSNTHTLSPVFQRRKNLVRGESTTTSVTYGSSSVNIGRWRLTRCISAGHLSSRRAFELDRRRPPGKRTLRRRFSTAAIIIVTIIISISIISIIIIAIFQRCDTNLTWKV